MLLKVVNKNNILALFSTINSCKKLYFSIYNTYIKQIILIKDIIITINVLTSEFINYLH